uniref:Uncharacterized protein n=1 Tax=Phakopsora pachyrhizi TaxID=170000 RepID=A0A0S1MKN9_PHAPC
MQKFGQHSKYFATIYLICSKPLKMTLGPLKNIFSCSAGDENLLEKYNFLTTIIIKLYCSFALY